MSTHQISPTADAAREAARQDNGQFGTQPKAESGVVDLLAGTAYDPRPKAMTMDSEEFEEMFGAHIEAPSGNAMWDFAELQDADIPTDRVWTVVENGENENLYALPGYHVVNKVDYLVTPQPWGNPDIEVLWHDENDMYDEERDGGQDTPGAGGICPDCENELTETQAMDGHCPFCADAQDAQSTLSEETYTEFGDDQGWAQLNTTPALAPRTDQAVARLELAVRRLKADPSESSARMERNCHIEALAMSREGRMLLAGMSDEQLGGEFIGNERETLVDHGKKKSTKLHAHFNATALGAGAVPVSVAEARRTLPEGAQIEVVYLQRHPSTIEAERDFRVVASQSERSMETLRRGEAQPVRNDWARKTTMVDARDNIIVCDEFGAPYVAYRHV